MEISPIAGIRVMPVMKAPRVDAELTAVFDIENSSKPGDDEYSAGGKKAAGAEDDEAVGLEDDVETEPVAQASVGGRAGQIDFFA